MRIISKELEALAEKLICRIGVEEKTKIRAATRERNPPSTRSGFRDLAPAALTENNSCTLAQNQPSGTARSLFSAARAASASRSGPR
jgi:hypothetical protein